MPLDHAIDTIGISAADHFLPVAAPIEHKFLPRDAARLRAVDAPIAEIGRIVASRVAARLRIHPGAGQSLGREESRPMNPSEKFLRFAAECELTAKFTHSPENKTSGRGWRRDGSAAPSCMIKRHRRRAPRWRPSGTGRPPRAGRRMRPRHRLLTPPRASHRTRGYALASGGVGRKASLQILCP
jgi:hypothetical protein